MQWGFEALQQLAARRAELDTTDSGIGLKIRMEFETKLRDLLGRYGYRLDDIPNLTDWLYPQGFNHCADVAFRLDPEGQLMPAGVITQEVLESDTQAERQMLGAREVDYGCIKHLLVNRPYIRSKEELQQVEALYAPIASE